MVKKKKAATLLSFHAGSPTVYHTFKVDKNGEPAIDGGALSWQDVLNDCHMYNFQYPLDDDNPAAPFCDELLERQGCGHRRIVTDACKTERLRTGKVVPLNISVFSDWNMSNNTMRVDFEVLANGEPLIDNGKIPWDEVERHPFEFWFDDEPMDDDNPAAPFCDELRKLQGGYRILTGRSLLSRYPEILDYEDPGDRVHSRVRLLHAIGIRRMRSVRSYLQNRIMWRNVCVLPTHLYNVTTRCTP